MAGILSGLFGYGTDAEGQITSPSLLGQFGRGLQNNSDALMGFGMGMLSGKNGYDNWANAAQLMHQGSALDRQRQIDITKRLKDASAQKAAEQYASQLPENMRGLVMANPDLASKFASADYEKMINPDQGQLIERNGKTYRVFKNGTAQIVSDLPQQMDPGQVVQRNGQAFRIYNDGRPAEPVAGLPAEKEELDRQLDAAGITDPATRQKIYQQKLGLTPAPKFETLENPDGSKQTVRVAPDGQALDPYTGRPLPGPQTAGQRNPYAMPGKNNDEQNKAAGFANRMARTHEIISQNEDVNTGTGRIGGNVNDALGDYAPAWIKSEKRQTVEQAERDFVNAVLRRESGAAISPAEFENARKQYFPQPGDPPEVIAQKRAAREVATQGVMTSAGPNYKPPQTWAGGSAPKFNGLPDKGQSVKHSSGATITRID